MIATSCAVGHLGGNGLDSRFLQVQVDLRCVERLGLGDCVQLAQQPLGQLHRALIAKHAEHIAAIGDLHAEAQLDLAQMLVEGPDQVGQALAVVGFKREVVVVGYRS